MWATHTATGASLPISVTPATLTNFGAYVLDIYRQRFTHELAAGNLKPLIIPYSLLGTFIAPVLYFSVPHTTRPWLHRARFPLMLCIVAFNLSETVTTSSANVAVGYAVGLMQAWGILWNATLLLWMNPQFEAERVERRRRRRRTRDGTHVANGHAEGQNGHSIESVDGAVVDAEKPQVHVLEAPDEDVSRSLREGYEYYWQAYPADAPFATRFEWSFDLVSSFRGTGWNWGVPILPRFAKAEKPLSESTVDLASIPLVTRQGFRRFKTSREWVRAKISTMLVQYLALDVLSVLMMKDPYFILGPELAAELIAATPLALPPFLAALPPPVISVYRSLMCFAAILIAIDLIMTVWHLFAHFILGTRVLGARAELWHYPTVYGGFTPCVLDKGMVGFWGGWWHQTFRVAFSAPGVWLGRHGYIKTAASAEGKAVAGLLAFVQSGFLHSLGSVSCLPHGRPYMPPAFFLLCWVGILVQTALSGVLRAAGVRERMPVWARRAGNFGFTFAWLVYFQSFFSDDIARDGIWMLEPVPASPLRALGLGRPGDHWMRWDESLWPRWYAGRRWWESGIAL
ncbi:unnamed protein product [Discula destructiva]